MPREPIPETFIANTAMEKVINSLGRHTQYAITPNEGYVLHDKRLDTQVIDENTLEPTGEVILGYTPGTVSCSASYDFVTNPWEFYAVLRTEVPENQIFGSGNNKDHEVM